MGRRGARGGVSGLVSSHSKLDKMLVLFGEEWDAQDLDEEDLDLISNPINRTQMMAPMIRRVAAAQLTRFSVSADSRFRLDPDLVGNFVRVLHSKATLQAFLNFLEFQCLTLPSPDIFHDRLQREVIVANIPHPGECRSITEYKSSPNHRLVRVIDGPASSNTFLRLDETLASIQDCPIFVVEGTREEARSS